MQKCAYYDCLNTLTEKQLHSRRRCCGKSCAAKHRRANTDPVKDAIFREKVRENMKNEWKKDQTTRINNMAKKIRENIRLMTPQERREKYGWQNKLSPAERADFNAKNLPKSILSVESKKKALKNQPRGFLLTQPFGEQSYITHNIDTGEVIWIDGPGNWKRLNERLGI